GRFRDLRWSSHDDRGARPPRRPPHRGRHGRFAVRGAGGDPARAPGRVGHLSARSRRRWVAAVPSLRFVLPARDAGPSGGDIYDAHVAAAWAREHGRADVVALAGPWPRPGPVERRALARALKTADPVL